MNDIGIWFGGDLIEHREPDLVFELEGGWEMRCRMGRVEIRSWQKFGTRDDPPEGANVFLSFL